MEKISLNQFQEAVGLYSPAIVYMQRLKAQLLHGLALFALLPG